MKGGGSRVMTFANNTTKLNIMQALKELFFPNGKSKMGEMKDFTFEIGNYQSETIPDTFKLSDYINEHRLSRTRLYLMTRKKGNSWLEELCETNASGDSVDEFEVDPPLKKKSIPKIDLTSTIAADGVKDKKSFESESSALIGTSDERQSLSEEIYCSYNESYAIDQKKQCEKEKEELKEKHLLALMEARKARLEFEPSLAEAHVIISVRHCTMGLKVRLFREDLTFVQVYDWIGSLSTRPQHFRIMDYKGAIISPDNKLYSGVFNMAESEKPVPMSPKGTIAFEGFGTLQDQVSVTEESSSTVTLQNQEEDKPQCRLLCVEGGEEVFVDDFEVGNKYLDVDNDHLQRESSFQIIESLRQSEFEKLKFGVSESYLSRSDIYNEMINLYKKRGTLSQKMQIRFIGEEAEGDGVTRDAYSAFYAELYNKFDGEREKIPNVMNFPEEHLETIGKIIHHGFIQFGLFPYTFCKATIKQALFGEVDETELTKSFLQFIPENEAIQIFELSEGKKVDTEAITDLLSEYAVFEIPKRDNIWRLCRRAANSAIIRIPYFAVQSICKGMGSFWNRVDASMIDALYGSTKPASSRLIKSLCVSEQCAKDQKLTAWLQRFIRSCTNAELGSLIRFITGMTNLTPDAKIKVGHVNQSPGNLRPLSQTCFRILLLPRQYASFYEMKTNLTTYLRSEDSWQVNDNFVVRE